LSLLYPEVVLGSVYRKCKSFPSWVFLW